MTREEAIARIKDHIIVHKMHEPRAVYISEALEMAIQELSQEPTDENLHREREQAYMQGYEDASKRFRPEPCDDAISRKDAEQMFRNIRSHLKPQDYKSAEEFNTRDLMLLNAEQMIHILPSVTQKSGKWIPVSKRLPEEAYGCLVTVYDTDLRTQDEFENILPYFVGYDGETWNNADGEPIPFEVVAWMPLPKPYEPQESEVNNG